MNYLKFCPFLLILLISCDETAVILRADFEELSSVSSSSVDLPGAPDGDLLNTNQADVSIESITAFGSSALQLSNQPFVNGQTVSGQFVDFVVAGDSHSEGEYIVKLKFAQQATGFNTGYASISLLSSSDRPIVLIDLSKNEQGEGELIVYSASKPVANQNVSESLGIYTAADPIVLIINVNTDRNSFDISSSGGVLNSVTLTDRLLLTELADIKKLRFSFNSKDPNPIVLGIDDVSIVKKL